MMDRVVRVVVVICALAEAMVTHVSDWDRACQVYGKPKDCGLSRHSSERLDRLLREAREECFRKYLYTNK